jgi:hypothetical protein
MKNAEIEVGQTLLHAEHGEVEVVKVTKRTVTIMGADIGEIKVKAATLELTEAAVADLADVAEAEPADVADGEELDEDAPADGTSMKEQMNRFRVGYVDTVSHSGNKSQSNGDLVAIALAGLSGEQVCRVAMTVIPGLEVDLVEKYEHLNEGQRRMNSGNRIRAAVKREENPVAIEDVQKACADFAKGNQEAAATRAAIKKAEADAAAEAKAATEAEA